MFRSLINSFSTEFKKEYSMLCVEHLLPLFENSFPQDKRPREILTHLKEGNNEKAISLLKTVLQKDNAFAAHSTGAVNALYAVKRLVTVWTNPLEADVREVLNCSVWCTPNHIANESKWQET